jgi:hypothetical protein
MGVRGQVLQLGGSLMIVRSLSVRTYCQLLVPAPGLDRSGKSPLGVPVAGGIVASFIMLSGGAVGFRGDLMLLGGFAV